MFLFLQNKFTLLDRLLQALLFIIMSLPTSFNICPAVQLLAVVDFPRFIVKQLHGLRVTGCLNVYPSL